jgi:7,8-dihydropterin-6-yl-methyl-4-(beta-D-ribofuranosyl)aminobenzene 5'-phosphate synthase
MSAPVRITVLVENTAQGPGLLGEHGLAYWIEREGRHVLLDTGQGGVLATNAYRLGVPLRQADAIVLSHGHYDHTGGLADALRGQRPCPIYVHPAALEPKYARNKDGTWREIGMPLGALQAVQQRAAAVVKTQCATEVFDGLWCTGPVPRNNDFETTGGPFFLDRECHRPDPLLDDQALFFESARGVVVLLGCAHAGVVNTLRYVRQLAGGKAIYAVLGGMHLAGAPAERTLRTVEELRELQIDRLAPAHCTGMAATAAFWTAFPGRCFPCHVGAKFEYQAP